MVVLSGKASNQGYPMNAPRRRGPRPPLGSGAAAPTWIGRPASSPHTPRRVHHRGSPPARIASRLRHARGAHQV